MDDHKGLRAAARRVFNATHQRCRIHWMRNALAHTPAKQRTAVAAMLKTIFAQETKVDAETQWEIVADALREKQPKLGALIHSVPHRLIGRQVDFRLTHRALEIFYNHERVAVHHRRGPRGGHTTIREHMPKAHQRYGGMTPESLIERAARTGYHTAALVERLMRDRPHPEQGYRSALGVLNLRRQFTPDRLEAACERALTTGTISYGSVRSILITGLDRAPGPPEPVTAPPRHDNIRGPGYYQ